MRICKAILHNCFLLWHSQLANTAKSMACVTTSIRPFVSRSDMARTCSVLKYPCHCESSLLPRLHRRQLFHYVVQVVALIDCKNPCNTYICTQYIDMRLEPCVSTCCIVCICRHTVTALIDDHKCRCKTHVTLQRYSDIQKLGTLALSFTIADALQRRNSAVIEMQLEHHCLKNQVPQRRSCPPPQRRFGLLLRRRPKRYASKISYGAAAAKISDFSNNYNGRPPLLRDFCRHTVHKWLHSTDLVAFTCAFPYIWSSYQFYTHRRNVMNTMKSWIK